MRALKLRLRRDPDAPTLRERAASLRASVARLKRPKADALPEAGSQEARVAFAAACRLIDRLGASARLGYPELRRTEHEAWTVESLNRALETGEIAVPAFVRLVPLAAEREHRINAARLTTNIDALFALANADDYPQAAEPEDDAMAEHAIGFVTGDGTVSYRDAGGKLHTRFTAAWINFTLQRLYMVACQEKARQFNAVCADLSKAECEALEARLERELRVSGLLALSFKGRLPDTLLGPSQAVPPDPVFEAIHRQQAALRFANLYTDDCPEADAASEREDEAWARMLETRPTTAAGLLALVRAIGAGSVAHTRMDGEPHLFAAIADGLTALMVPTEPELPSDVARRGAFEVSVTAALAADRAYARLCRETADLSAAPILAAERAVDDAWTDTTRAADALAALPAGTADGLRLKLRALALYEPGTDARTPGGRLLLSLLRDAGTAPYNPDEA